MIGRTNAVIGGGGGTGFDPECIGTVGSDVYVYHDTTIEAGDFIKFTEGIGTVESGTEGEYQTHDLTENQLTGASGFTNYTKPGSPKLKWLDENTVIYIRTIGKGSDSDSYSGGFGITLGVVDSTGVNIEWGTELIKTWTGNYPFELGRDVCALGNNKFLFLSYASAGYYSYDTYSYSGTVMTRLSGGATECGFATEYSPTTYGLTYLEPGKVLLASGYETNNTSSYKYLSILTLNESTNYMAFGTTVNCNSGIYGTIYPISLGSNRYYIYAHSSSTVSTYIKVTDTTITNIKANLGMSHGVNGYYYDSDRNVLVCVNSARKVSNGVGTITLTIAEYEVSDTTLTKGNTYTVTIEIPVLDTTTNLQQHKLISEMPGLYLGRNCGYIHMGVQIGNLASESYWTTYYFTGLSFIIKHTESGYEVVDFRHKYYTGERRLIGVATALSETRVVTGCSHLREPGTDTASAIETVIEGVNPEGFNFNTYNYETQVIKAESNDDIKGVAITSGVGGTETQHNDTVRIRQNV